MSIRWGFFLLLAGCAAGPRILSESEKEKHGLTGVIYDARLCPVKDGRTAGDCELVTCEPGKSGVDCRAIPESKPRKF